MRKLLAALYSALVYLFFLGVFLYAIGFVENVLVPKSIDSASVDSMTCCNGAASPSKHLISTPFKVSTLATSPSAATRRLIFSRVNSACWNI